MDRCTHLAGPHAPRHLVVANLVEGAVRSVVTAEMGLTSFGRSRTGPNMPGLGPDLLLHAKTERVSRRISVDLEERVLFFDWIGKDAGTELDRTR